MIEIHRIQHARVLAEHRNFARAAQALNIAQPSLSRSIAALEHALGVTLFDRSHKGVTPTPYGRILLEHGEALLKREFDLRREIRLLAGLEEGSLAVSAGPYMAETSVAIAIARVTLAHPRLKIRCSSADPAEVVNEVLAGRIDVGVAGTGGLADEDRLVVDWLPVRRIYLACRPGHPLAGEDSPSLTRALQFPLVTTLLRGAHAALASSRGAEPGPQDAHHPDLQPQISVNSVALARLIARESNALFPATASMLAEDVAAGRLIRLECDAPAMRTNPGVFHLRGRTLAPSAQAFIDTLKKVESESPYDDAAATNEKAAQGRPRTTRQRRKVTSS